MIIQGITVKNTTVADPYITTSNLAIWIDANNSDSSGQTFYINGQQVGTTTYSSAGNSHSITGNTAWSNGGQAFGYIANMLLYTAKLSQTQIQQNYTALRNRFSI